MSVEMPMSKTFRSQRCIPLDVQASVPQMAMGYHYGGIQMADEDARVGFENKIRKTLKFSLKQK